MATWTPQALINQAFLSNGRLAEGEIATGNAATSGMNMANLMLDQWSTQHLFCYYQTEIVWTLTNSVYQYSIGPQGNVTSVFQASIAPLAGGNSTLTVTSLTSGQIALGMTIVNNGITNTVIAFGSGTGVGPNALGTYILGGTQQTVASTAMTGYYQRPVRMSSGFVRINSSIAQGIDYPISVANVENFEMIGLKQLNGPWPRALYYQAAMPNGNIQVWPNPAQGEMHVFADTQLQQFGTLTDQLTLAPGYAMAIMWNLSYLTLPQYGKKDPAQIQLIAENAASGRAWVKRNNMQPVQNSIFDPILVPGSGNDAAWIYSGGFN